MISSSFLLGFPLLSSLIISALCSIHDSESESGLKEGLHNGKFVIYDKLDRQMVESSMDGLIAEEDDRGSYPVFTQFLAAPMKRPKGDSLAKESAASAKSPSIADSGSSNAQGSPFTGENDFGYKLSNNHQIQGKRPKIFRPYKHKGHKMDSTAAQSVPVTSFLRPEQAHHRPLFEHHRRPVPNLRPIPYMQELDHLTADSFPAPVHSPQFEMPRIQTRTPFEAPSASFAAPGYIHRYEYQVMPPSRGQSPFLGFYHQDRYEDMAASDAALYIPEGTKVAIENHADLTEKQRDALLNILENYYRLIHQFNIDFRRLISESRQRQAEKLNSTIVLDPVRPLSSEPVPAMVYVPRFHGKLMHSNFYPGQGPPFLT